MSGADAAPADRDPGLQPERTRLAWRRTTLSSTVVAVLAARTRCTAARRPSRCSPPPTCCVLWLAFLRIAHRRIGTLAAANQALRPHPGARRRRGAVHAGPRRLRGVLLVLPHPPL